MPSSSTAPRVDTTVLDATAMLAIAMGRATGAVGPAPEQPRVVTGADVAGAWRSPDGTVTLQLRADGTYAAEVSGRRQRPRGTYRIDGGRLVLHDDASGLHTPISLLHDGELEMAGHRLQPSR